ncbi:MAG: glycosyltransferase family 2 protein [Chitinophagaceae bacterium]|nr:glycosyltransferase family 2 protein [Chitinophagaceae bacterium]
MTDTQTISIPAEPGFGCAYSICTLVTDWEEYATMKRSFVEAGFDGQYAEYLVADNSRGNQFDAYQAINAFMQQARGRYTIMVHQDVRCLTGREQLDALLQQLHATDKAWCVCGNAGAYGYHREYAWLRNGGRDIKTISEPTRVNSLDENFLLLNNQYRIGLSYNVGGFHFYGTDICLHALSAGLHCYVIPFLVEHLSMGNLQQLDQARQHYLDACGAKLQHRFVQTTCTKFYLAGSARANRFFNSPPVFFFVKAWQRIKWLFRIS